MSRLSKFRLVGGPFDKWSGEFVDTDQRMVEWGPEGARNFVYRRRRKLDRDGTVRFVYDQALTRAALVEAGVDLGMVEAAIRDAEASLVRGLEPVPPGFARVVVTCSLEGDRWVMRVDGEVVDTRPRREFAADDKESLGAWVRSVMCTNEQQEVAS